MGKGMNILGVGLLALAVGSQDVNAQEYLPGYGMHSNEQVAKPTREIQLVDALKYTEPVIQDPQLPGNSLKQYEYNRALGNLNPGTAVVIFLSDVILPQRNVANFQYVNGPQDWRYYAQTIVESVSPDGATVNVRFGDKTKSIKPDEVLYFYADRDQSHEGTILPDSLKKVEDVEDFSIRAAKAIEEVTNSEVATVVEQPQPGEWYDAYNEEIEFLHIGDRIFYTKDGVQGQGIIKAIDQNRSDELKRNVFTFTVGEDVRILDDELQLWPGSQNPQVQRQQTKERYYANLPAGPADQIGRETP